MVVRGIWVKGMMVGMVKRIRIRIVGEGGGRTAYREGRVAQRVPWRGLCAVGGEACRRVGVAAEYLVSILSVSVCVGSCTTYKLNQ